MIGNAHIDPVWLWSWQAGVDEALATFRSAADRCEEYPEFVFTRGESWLFEQVERIDPELFERVRRLVESGRWHITGGQYIQPDVNLSTVMGLHRQIIHGQRYFKDRFGVSPKVGYNVDSFGHPARRARGPRLCRLRLPSPRSPPGRVASPNLPLAGCRRGGGDRLSDLSRIRHVLGRPVRPDHALHRGS